MKKILLVGIIALIGRTVNAQFVQFNPGNDTTKTITLEGYADVYFGYDFNKPGDGNRPYFVSQHRHSEFNVNLAYLAVKYNAPRVRATFTPGFGTYMNANYVAEPGTLKNIVEANIGVKPFKNKNIWLDVGVMGAPFTTESAISFDQLLYTRTFAAEYSPFFLTGAKLSLPLGEKVNLYLYLVNGWQVIQDVNDQLSFASQLEYKPNEQLTLQWSSYIGNEQSAAAPNNRERFFSDLFMVYNPSGKLSFSLDLYGGTQNLKDSLSNKSSVNFGQANLNAKYAFNEFNSLSARAEYYSDRHSIFITPITGVSGFECYSYSLCYNLSITKNVLFRAEGRYFHSPREVFKNPDLNPSNNGVLLIGGLTAKF